MSGCDPMIVSNPAKSAAVDFYSVRNASQIVDNVYLNSVQCRSDGKKIHSVVSDIYCEWVPHLFQHLGRLIPNFKI